MKIAMVGSGYVGLVSGACFADFGHDVVCIDKDQRKIDALHKKRMDKLEKEQKMVQSKANNETRIKRMVERNKWLQQVR